MAFAFFTGSLKTTVTQAEAPDFRAGIAALTV